MCAAIEWPTRADTADGPPSLMILRRLRKPLDQAPTEFDLAFRRHAFERRFETHHIGVTGLRRIERQFGARRACGLHEGHRVEHIELLALAKATRCASPQRPPFRPDLTIVDVLNAVIEERPQLLDTPLIERIAKTGTHAIAGQIEPETLVVRRAAPAFHTFPQRVEQLAQQRAAPACTRAEDLLQFSARALDLLGVDFLRARAEGAVDQFKRLGQGRVRRFAGHGDFGFATAQLEFEQPALCGVAGVDAMHFQRAHFGERSGELDRCFRRVARAAWGDNRGDRRQAHEFAQGQLG